jgi:hypothetical protein
MTTSRHPRVAALAALFSLVLFACVVDEDLLINADGSGTYQVKVTVPKDLTSDFGDFRKSAEKDGFTVVEEGETENGRFVVLRKKFTDISTLNDQNSHFAFTAGEMGLLKREYRLRAELNAVAYGAYKRHLVVTMPGGVTGTTAGEADGSRVRWDASNGGTIEVTAVGYAIPLSHDQRMLMLVVLLAGVLLLIAQRRRNAGARTICSTCQSPFARDARFCAGCGVGASIP